MNKIKIGNTIIVHLILKNGSCCTKAIFYTDEADKLFQIQKFIKYNAGDGIFQVIFYHTLNGNQILDKALWGI